jgi:ATP-dependent RNA helicase RhlE
MSFASFGLASGLVSALGSLGIDSPTSVQAQAIPAIAEGRDIIVTAKTGSGKSLAYALPLLNARADTTGSRRSCVLVVVPTRELVIQLGELFQQLTEQLPPIKFVELVGGGSINPQLMRLRGGADFIFATPGRLLDVIGHNVLDLSAITTVVLDEADRLLDTGFQDQTNEILDQLPQCQRLLLSATFSKKVNAKAKWLLKNPLTLDLTEAVAEIVQRAIQVDSEQRSALLVYLLKDLQSHPALIFAADRKGAERLTLELSKKGFNAKTLHGKLSMAQRGGVMAKLKDGTLGVLVATDLAARGIDIPSLPLVINYDLPRSTELYTHRIGRTGRAGEAGLAISFVDINAEAHFALIEKRLGNVLDRETIEGFLPINVLERPTLTDGAGGIKGKRMSKKDKLRAAAENNKPSTSQP